MRIRGEVVLFAYSRKATTQVILKSFTAADFADAGKTAGGILPKSKWRGCSRIRSEGEFHHRGHGGHRDRMESEVGWDKERGGTGTKRR